MKIWDGAVPDGDTNIRVQGCSNAVASEAAPSSTNDVIDIDIAQRMGYGPVNLMMATSAMGRGIMTDGELDKRLRNQHEIMGKT